MLQDMAGPPSWGATAASSERNSPTGAVLRVRDCRRVNAATRSTPEVSGDPAMARALLGLLGPASCRTEDGIVVDDEAREADGGSTLRPLGMSRRPALPAYALYRVGRQPAASPCHDQ